MVEFQNTLNGKIFENSHQKRPRHLSCSRRRRAFIASIQFLRPCHASASDSLLRLLSVISHYDCPAVEKLRHFSGI
jgi:hypothetical protein